MPGPFQQTRTAFQDFQKALSPTAFLQPTGAAFEAAQGAAKDAMFDRCLQAVKAKYPSVAPGDALAAIGADRMMPRGGSETDAAYAARLLNAWNTWPWAGTAYGLLQAFYSTGYRNVVVAQALGGKQFTLDTGGTNLLTWSNDFGNAAWSKNTGVTVTRNFATAPDGTTTASRLQYDGSGASASFRLWHPGAVVPNGQLCCSSWWMRANAPVTVRLSNNLANVTVCNLTTSWNRFSVGDAGNGVNNLNNFIFSNAADNSAFDIQVAYAQTEYLAAPSAYSPTYGIAKPTALAAGSLLTSTMACGIWETDPLSSYSPASQSFWSKFDVLFPLPLMPPSWGWSGGIPSSSSAEANFIRALIQAWKPAHATCDRILIHQQGKLWGYPATQLWGSSGALWGGSANTVWTP